MQYLPFQMECYIRLVALTLLISFLPKQSLAQSLQISNLESNPGLLILQDGCSFMKIGEHKLFHIIDVLKYEPILIKLQQNINGINFIRNFTGMTELLETKLSKARQIYEEFLPKFRTKRGLLNFVGTGIKQITGNLDNNDLSEISQKILDLKLNNKMLITENNEQVKINYQLQNRLNRVIHQLNIQQSQITQKIIAARNENDTKKYIIVIEEIFKINLILDHLISHLNDIFEAIKLAKSKIISKHILSLEELSFATQKIEANGITLNSLEETYDFLDLIAFHNKTKIIFIVLIPLIDSSNYKNLLIEPLIIGNKILKLPSSTAIQDDRSTYFVIKECQRVQGNHLCTKDNLLNITEDPCFSRIFRGHSGKCSFIGTTSPYEIRPITGNHIVLKQVNSLTLASNCGISNRTLTGTFLVEFHNCSVILNGSRFDNTELIKTAPPLTLPLDGLEIHENNFEPLLRVEELNIANRHLIEDLTRQHTAKTLTSTLMSSTSIIICIVVVITLIIMKVRISFRSCNSASTDETMETDTDVITLPINGHRPPIILSANRDASDFKEGRVKNGP